VLESGVSELGEGMVYVWKELLGALRARGWRKVFIGNEKGNE